MNSKLPNAPLQEAIFELRWQLQPDSTGKQLHDAEYPFALGKFEEALKHDFPHRVSKFPGDIPHRLLNYQAVHQFWKEEKKWPVIQLGPGIASVNDTDENYAWDTTYLPNIKFMLAALRKSYHQLDFDVLSLRYIDVVRASDYGKKNWIDFVKSHVNFNFSYNFDTRGPLAQFNFEQTFDMKDLGMLNITFATGLNNFGEEVFIWQTAVINKKRMKFDSVISWVEDAHQCASNTFREICKNDFYASFTQ